MKRGDVMLVFLPSPQGGSEQAGDRPAVVVHADGFRTGSQMVLIVPATSQTAAMRFPCSLLVQPSQLNGLTSPTVLLVSQLRAIDSRRIGRRLGELQPQDMTQLDQGLRRILQL